MKHLIVLWVIVAVAFVPVAAVAAEKKFDYEKAFNTRDADGDQALSREEYLAGRKPEAKARHEKRFGKLDKDGNGSLSLAEFSTPRESAKKPGKGAKAGSKDAKASEQSAGEKT